MINTDPLKAVFGVAIGALVGVVLALALWLVFPLGWWTFAIIIGCVLTAGLALDTIYS